MTFNLRVPAEADGINYFDNRRERILEVLRRESPDLIGFQEASAEGKAWLCRELGGDYTVFGCGRNKNCSGEYVPVAIRNSMFEVMGAETFWLSPTPNIPGSRYTDLDQSGCVRIATATALWHRETGQIIRFVNLHTDHVGKEARKKELEQVLEYLKKRQGYKIVTGDMNAEPDSEEITSFLTSAAELGIRDCTEGIGGTFHGYGNYNAKIDYIFSDLESLNSHAVTDTPVDGLYYSDHLAVCAELLWDV
jgi:endonuclease/exonuclease/phosphatase family metal-dependent hydrolase